MSSSAVPVNRNEASDNVSGDSIMNFYKAERLRVVRMRQQLSSEKSSPEIKEATAEEMEVEITNDENASSKEMIFSAIPHRLACKRLGHPSPPFLPSNVKRMKWE